MTRAQKRRIDRMRDEVEKNLFFGEGYEIKEWTVTDCGSFVSIVFETGLVNDEGTLASIFARDRGHVFIGERGGVRYPVFKNGRSYTKRYRSVLGVVLDQR